MTITTHRLKQIERFPTATMDEVQEMARMLLTGPHIEWDEEPSEGEDYLLRDEYDALMPMRCIGVDKDNQDKHWFQAPIEGQFWMSRPQRLRCFHSRNFRRLITAARREPIPVSRAKKVSYLSVFT